MLQDLIKLLWKEYMEITQLYHSNISLRRQPSEEKKRKEREEEEEENRRDFRTPNMTKFLRCFLPLFT